MPRPLTRTHPRSTLPPLPTPAPLSSPIPPSPAQSNLPPEPSPLLAACGPAFLARRAAVRPPRRTQPANRRASPPPPAAAHTKLLRIDPQSARTAARRHTPLPPLNGTQTRKAAPEYLPEFGESRFPSPRIPIAAISRCVTSIM